MTARTRRTAAVVTGLTLGVGLAGCGLLDQVTNMFNPDLLSSLGLGGQVASLPGDAPGLLVAVENRTDRIAAMVVSYRDSANAVQTYTTQVAPNGKSAQMLVCPIGEITLGDVSNLKQSGARIFLLDTVAADPNAVAAAPFIEVDPFGVLLEDTVNYRCGDGLTFTVQSSSAASSGYQVFAFIRRSGT
jgi:hypothetical protein